MRQSSSIRNLFRLKTGIDDTTIKPFENEKEIYGNTTEDVRNLFRLEKEIDYNTIKYVRNIYRLTERK